MKAFVHTIAVILLFASCCPSAAKGNGMEIYSMVDSVGSDLCISTLMHQQVIRLSLWT